MTGPDFLTLPTRASRPRSTGLTHVLDNGIPLAATSQLLDSIGPFVDIWKFGWGTAYLDPRLTPKLRLLEEHGVRACLGGTMMEIAWAQGKVDECLEWAGEAGLPMVEVSRGVMPMTRADKDRVIRRATASFTVLSEVGSKNPAQKLAPTAWADEVAGDLDSGAWLVVTEGRESGTVGTFDPQGGVMEPVVDAVVGVAGAERILFEAPQKDQQACFIRRFGADVNLGNIALDKVLALEALRLGLRADTAALPSAAGSGMRSA
jgi:phosphosulfolactate synthase